MQRLLHRFDVLGAHLTDGIWEWTVPTGEDYLSPGWKASLGYEDEELPNTVESWFKLLHPDDHERAQEAVSRHFEKGEPYDIDLRYIHKDGTIRWMRARGEVVERDDNGNPLKMFGTHTDVTRYYEKRVELEEVNDLLSRKTEELDQFAYAASHDLQEPLRMVSQYVSLIEAEVLPLVEDHCSEEQVQEAKLYMHYAKDGAHRMRAMLDGLLAYSRAGRVNDTFERVRAERVVADAIATLNGAIKQAGATIDVEPLPTIYADKQMLSRVFLNLFTNAIKFRHPDRELVVKVSAVDCIDHFRFTVSDNGRGFDPRFADRIFTIFQRLNKAVKGTGIGLSVSKKVIERHGGTIWAEGVPGEGASFHFTIKKYEDML